VSERKRFRVTHAESRQRAIEAVRTAPDGWHVVVSEPTRTLDQNATQWPILEAFARQAEWPINGRMCQMTAEEWKDVLTAAFEGESVRLAAGWNGGVVMLGLRTREFGKRKFSDWIDFLYACAAEKGVVVHADEVAA
jgi:hypothetical protein